ncbi:uncharacterized protein LOC122386735 isoform X2 [Amphibalanus amphitrite]|uniref:uncharacterized protein LOC122386735 isoform X2 n=1 Tax=Amphibalanus amphitrite TaxID=1232801 RepID=UPI001C90E9F7|nr:uncharacterized protein LOC122386735 isoform X2 [Amphibalanus amphitrite]
METMTAKPGGMALNGLSEASPHGRHRLSPGAAAQHQTQHQACHQSQHQARHQSQHHHQYQPVTLEMYRQLSGSGTGRQVSHSSSAGSLDSEPPTPVFRAYLTPPPDQSPFPFPARPERTASGPETESTPRAQPETPPTAPGRRQTEVLSENQETQPKQVYQETVPKQPLRSESSGRFLYPDPAPPGSLASDPEPSPPNGRPRFPYPGSEPASAGSEPRHPYPGSESGPVGGEPRFPYPGSEPQYVETDPKFVYQETEPKRAAPRPPGCRRYSSEANSPRPRPRCWLKEAGRSQSDEPAGHRLSEAAAAAAAAAGGPQVDDSSLDADETGQLSVNSDMRGMQAHVQNSNHVHVGPKVFDQRQIHVDRVNSLNDHSVHHQCVQTKQENIGAIHEYVQHKKEVHNTTENIRIDRIENKTEHIQWNNTEILHNTGGAIYANRLILNCDCKQSSPTSPSPSQRPFQEAYKFLKTRYISFTALSSPLPWYDGMVHDIRKSCIDFSMVSMGGNSSTQSYGSVEQLVRDQQQQSKALRIIVEGHAGYGKSTLAARVAFDWATGADYLKEYSHAFLIYLRELRGPLDEHIRELHYPQERPDGDAFLEYITTNPERVLFIFDGYDELAEDLRKSIDSIMSGNAFMHSGALLTSRPMPMSFKKHCQYVSLVGFDAAKQSEFVRLVYGDRPQTRIEHFLSDLERDRSKAELAQCPLMCLLLCEMYQRGKAGAHATKSQVYQELFHYLIGKAVHRRHPQPLAEESTRLAASYQQALAAFGAFCLQCLATDQLTFRKSDIPAGCGGDLLFEIGFIVKCRHFSSKMCSETFYEPIHKTFLEFLAAQYLCSIIGEEETLKRELLRLRQGTSPTSVQLILQYLCGLRNADAWTVMDQLDLDGTSRSDRDLLFSLLREAGETELNVAAVCRRLPQDRVTVYGSHNHLAMWALCLSSPASKVGNVEFLWDVGSGRAGDEIDELVAVQLGFWSALQSCANITDLRVTFIYGESSEVPAAFVDAMCECMKHCARLTRLEELHVKATAPDSGADALLPVVSSLSQHVRSCTSLKQLTMDMNLSSEMTKQLCTGLVHVPRLQTLRILRLFCNAGGYDALASLIGEHIGIKELEVSVALADGPTDLNTTSITQLKRNAMQRIKEMPRQQSSPELAHKPLCRAPHRTGPDQELEHLKDALSVNLKDERRVRVVEGVWCLVDPSGSRGLYPLPMCDSISHKAGHHRLLKAVRCCGARLERLTISQQTPMSRIDFACLGEAIRKSESLTHLTLADVTKAANLFPLITALPTTKRLESVVLKSKQVQMNDFLFFVLCRCLERNKSLQELNIQQWKFTLESASSMDYLRSLMKNTSLNGLVMAECRVSLGYRLDEFATFPSARLSSLNLSDCLIETAGGGVRRAAGLLPLLHGLSALSKLNLSDKAAPPLNDAGVKAFFAGLSGFKTLQELSIRGWRYDVSNPDTVYNETKTATKKCGRLTTVRIDNSHFSSRSTECGKQWLVQALATGVPHLQELSLAGLSAGEPVGGALTVTQLDQLAKIITKAKWTGDELRFIMDRQAMDTFVELTRVSSRIEVATEGRAVTFKRSRVGQWWMLRSK